MPVAHDASKVEVVNIKNKKETTIQVTTVEALPKSETENIEEDVIIEELNETENIVVETEENVVEVNRSEEKSNKHKHFYKKKKKYKK